MVSSSSSSKAVHNAKVILADLQILGSAFFFGIGFLGQRAVMINGLGPMTCNAFRFGLSTILLAGCLPLMPTDGFLGGLIEGGSGGHNGGDDESDDDEEEPTSADESKNVTMTLLGKQQDASVVLAKLMGPYAANITAAKKTVWFWGVLLGLINFGGSGFQQWGISLTSASKCAFIAGFDLFLTPIFSLFMKTTKKNAKPQPSTWLAVAISLCGLFLMSGSSLDEYELGMGESLTLVSTVFWTLHITYTDIATNYVDSISMMCIQFGVVTFLSSCAAFIFEPQQWLWDHLFVFLPWLLFLAISEGLGFTLMAVGQNFSPPTHAAIILSLEGVFASVASYMFIGEVLSTRELIGCSLMLLSTMVAKVGCYGIDRVKKKKEDNERGKEIQLTTRDGTSTTGSTNPL